jgi:hypothetical protein
VQCEVRFHFSSNPHWNRNGFPLCH